MGIEQTLSKLDDLARRAQTLAAKAQSQANEPLPTLTAQQLADRVARQLTEKVRACLLENFMGSGIKSRSGNLEKAVSSAVVWVAVRPDGRFILRYGFGSKDGKLQRYGNALNYGAVHAPHKVMAKYDLSKRQNTGNAKRSILGQKAKRTIKKLATGGGISTRAVDYLENASTSAVRIGGKMRKRNKGAVELVVKQNDGGRSLSVGSGENTVTVIPGRRFWALTAAQLAGVTSEFISLFKAELDAMHTRAAARKGA